VHRDLSGECISLTFIQVELIAGVNWIRRKFSLILQPGGGGGDRYRAIGKERGGIWRQCVNMAQFTEARGALGSKWSREERFLESNEVNSNWELSR
jgi:hypothetical protein